MGNLEKMKIENKFLKNELMSKHTSYRIGGPAKIFFTPANRDELIQGLKYAKSNKINIFFIQQPLLNLKIEFLFLSLIFLF